MIHGEIHSSLDKSQMLGSVIGLQAALQHSPFAFVVCSHEVAFSCQAATIDTLGVAYSKH